jgi:hypothetical protein
MTQTTESTATAEGRQAFSSVEITKNSRGWSYSVKVYCALGDEDIALDKAREMEHLLRQEYGDSNGE